METVQALIGEFLALNYLDFNLRIIGVSLSDEFSQGGWGSLVRSGVTDLSGGLNSLGKVVLAEEQIDIGLVLKNYLAQRGSLVLINIKLKVEERNFQR